MRVVLLGGGHCNVQVLQLLPSAEIVLISDGEEAIYSGMIPGAICGEYTAAEATINLRTLSTAHNAAFIPSPAVAHDPNSRVLTLADGETVGYDVLAVDIGSRCRGVEIAGVAEYCLKTRPLKEFLRAVGDTEQRLKAEGKVPTVVIAGAGAAGIELAFAFHRRWSTFFQSPVPVTLLDSTAELLPTGNASLRREVLQQLTARNIQLRLGETVTAVGPDYVQLATVRLPADITIWATGAAPHALDLSVPLCESGFVLVNDYLQSVAFPYIFAGGDCVTIAGSAPGFPPKAGVYAVREGPVVAHNIRALQSGARLQQYTPQRDFLCLLNTAQGEAIGCKYGCVFRGQWVRRWKDSIDRKFMRRFQGRNERRCSVW